jgi:hypothetical protein
MPRVETMEKTFSGTPFQRACLEIEQYILPPDKMTPIDIVTWAMDAGKWERVFIPGLGTSVWYGPISIMPQMGEPFIFHYDADKAMYHMRVQYASWWGQRAALEKALEFLQFGQAAGTLTCAKCGKKSNVTMRSMGKKGKGGPPCEPGFRGWVKCQKCGEKTLVQVNDPPDTGGLPCPKCETNACFPDDNQDPPEKKEK